MHVALIDKQGDSDGEFCYILIVQDLKTNFVQLRPLKGKAPKQVVEQLHEIFLTTSGAPIFS